MSHRGGNARGGGYTRGSSGFRQKGRNSGSPYWKDKPTGFNNAIETDSSNTMTPVRQPLVSSDPLPEQSPADEGRQNKEVKKFSNKSRLFIANLPRDTSEDELKELFSAYGEVQEVFIQKEKSFGFCRMVRVCVCEGVCVWYGCEEVCVWCVTKQIIIMINILFIDFNQFFII